MASGWLRTHTNQFEYHRVEKEINGGRRYGVGWRRIEQLSGCYELQRRTVIADIITADDHDSVREITLNPGNLTQIDYGIRRVGGKRNNWWEKGISGYWDVIKNHSHLISVMQHGTTQTLHTYSTCKKLLDKALELEGKWGGDREENKN